MDMENMPGQSRGETDRIPVSVIILARNEVANLPRCIAALGFTDDVIVVDDRSEDGTAVVARGAGARVVEHAMATFADQRNWAMEHAGAKHEWVLHLDADEIVTPPLAREVGERVHGCGPETAVFYMARKMMLGDKWLRFSGTYPAYVPRLVRRERVRFRQSGHGDVLGEVEGECDHLDEPCLHYNFSKGWAEWFERHDRYASREAAMLFRQCPELDLPGCFSSDPVRKRKAVRSLSYRLPLRPGLRFLYVYLLRGGFLDGKAGFRYCRLQARYERMIDKKLRESRSGISA